MNGHNDHLSDSGIFANGRNLFVSDEASLTRLVAERLDWPISQHLLDQGFKLSYIKRCWNDQLRLKRELKNILLITNSYFHPIDEDFASAHDLLLAYIILRKQIDYIGGNQENIVIPSVRMQLIRGQNGKFCWNFLFRLLLMLK